MSIEHKELTLFGLGFDGYIEPMEDGQYVSLSDYITLEAQLADAKQVANDCKIVADNAIAEALAAKKDSKRRQWLRISDWMGDENQVMRTTELDAAIDAAIQAEGKQA